MRQKKRFKSSKSKEKVLIATVDKNPRGFAFLIFDDPHREDLFVPPPQAKNLFPGDRVEARFDPHTGRVHHIRVIQHRFEELFGVIQEIHQTPRGISGVLLHQSRKQFFQIPFENAPSGTKPECWARAKILFPQNDTQALSAQILEVFGSELPASMDVQWVGSEYGLREDHPKAAVDQAEALRNKTLQTPSRMDLRKVPFITIDGPRARDFDDAIWVEEGPHHGFILWVGIADVSFYVTEGSALDQCARERGTSVYFPEKAYHMLPRTLSEDLCSLKPHVPRPALVCKMTFSKKGELKEIDLMEATILSQRRMTYEEMQKEHDQHQDDSRWRYKPMYELYLRLKEQRIHRGAIDLDLPETEIIVDTKGEPQSIQPASRFASHRLIEEFMVISNEAVTQWIERHGRPMVYRVHETPSEESLKKFQSTAKALGISFKWEQLAKSSKAVSEISRKIQTHPARSFLNMALLRSLKQAFYSADSEIHYGLASEGYTHFTSPIRRYPDLIIHRIVREILHKKRLSKQENSETYKKLSLVAQHCSYRERLSTEAEREVNRIKQIRLMKHHLGNSFPGQIVGMSEMGIWIQIEEPFVEGVLPRESLGDDQFQFNAERMVYVGKQTRKTFKLGQKLTVVVIRASLEKRQLELGLESS